MIVIVRATTILTPTAPTRRKKTTPPLELPFEILEQPYGTPEAPRSASATLCLAGQLSSSDVKDARPTGEAGNMIEASRQLPFG